MEIGKRKSSEIDQLGWSKIAKAQGDGTLPAWIIRNATTSKVELENGLWELSVCLFKKRKLESGEVWERRSDGSKVLVQVNPLDGEKRYVLTYTTCESDRVVLFRVQVDLESRDATILQSSSLGDLDPRSFEIFYE